MECTVRNEFTDSESIGKSSILIVDDDRDIRRMLADCLTMEGFRVTCAESGDEALMLLKYSFFCLMLTDYNMPGMDGLRLSEEALKASPGLIIVMITGAALTQVYRSAVELGITAVMAKPLNIKELFSIIGKAEAHCLAPGTSSLRSCRSFSPCRKGIPAAGH